MDPQPHCPLKKNFSLHLEMFLDVTIVYVNQFKKTTFRRCRSDWDPLLLSSLRHVPEKIEKIKNFIIFIY